MTPRSDRGVVVVGDALLDVDIEGTAERLSPDAPVPVLDERSRRARPGGAALTATLAALEGEAVTLVAPVATDRAGEELRGLLAACGVRLVDVVPSGPTPQKIRLLADGRPMLRLDRGGPPGPVGILTDEACQAVERAAVVVVSDYGRGLTADRRLRAALAGRRRPTLWDPHPRGTRPVADVTLVTPNRAELQAVLAAPGAPGSRPAARAGTDNFRVVAEATRALRCAWRARAVATTLGADGALFVDDDGPPLVVPAAAAEGGDPCGAGDRFIASVAAAVLGGALLSEAVTSAVSAASRFVAAGGARAVTAPGEGGSADAAAPARPTAPGRPAGAERSDGGDSAEALAGRIRSRGGTVVVAGGCFDLLHAGHVALLQAARRLGDCLIVAMNSDRSVRRLKGDGRPVVPEADRAALLVALSCVDAVAVFDEDTPMEVLTRLRPAVFAKGGDYSTRRLPETETLAAWGGQAVVLPYLSGRSTTGLLQLVEDLP